MVSWKRHVSRNNKGERRVKTRYPVSKHYLDNMAYPPDIWFDEEKTERNYGREGGGRETDRQTDRQTER